jgi:hypothetical protein
MRSPKRETRPKRLRECEGGDSTNCHDDRTCSRSYYVFGQQSSRRCGYCQSGCGYLRLRQSEDPVELRQSVTDVLVSSKVKSGCPSSHPCPNLVFKLLKKTVIKRLMFAGQSDQIQFQSNLECGPRSFQMLLAMRAEQVAQHRNSPRRDSTEPLGTRFTSHRASRPFPHCLIHRQFSIMDEWNQERSSKCFACSTGWRPYNDSRGNLFQWDHYGDVHHLSTIHIQMVMTS